MSYWAAFNTGFFSMLWPLLVPPLLLGAAIRTYNFFEGERLLHDLWYEFHLARTDIAAAQIRSSAKRSVSSTERPWFAFVAMAASSSSCRCRS